MVISSIWAARITAALFLQNYLSLRTKPKEALQMIEGILTNKTQIGMLQNATHISLENITAILKQYHDCLQSKIMKNITRDLLDCFVLADKVNSVNDMGECNTSDLTAAISFFMFLIGMFFLIGMSFGYSRKHCCLKCCFGRPGCVIPLNMLDSYENRFGNALAFGATTARCFFLVLGENRALVGKTLAMYLEDPSTPSFVSVFAKIGITIVLATAYYPLFACMSMGNKLVGSVLGTVYTLFWLGGAAERIVYTSKCLGSKRYMAFVMGFESPGILCLVLLLVKFLYVLQGAVRRWIDMKKKEYGRMQQMTYTEIFSDWKEQYMYLHVKNLLKGKRHFKEEDDDEDDIKLKDKLKKKLYEFKPSFKYSTRIICAFAVATYAGYMVVVALSFACYVFVTQVLKILVYSKDFENLLKNDAQSIKTFRAYFEVLHISFYVAAGSAGIVLTLVVMNMLSWYRKHIMKLRIGNKSWLPSSISQQTVSPASLTAASMKFAGYQVGYTVWGTTFLTVVFWVLFSVIGTQFVVPGIHRTWSPLLRLLYNLWPALFLSLLINFVQLLAAKFIFLHDRGASLSINNRNSFHVLSYFLFFFNIALGVVSCLLRIGYSVVLGVLFMARLQKSLLPRSYEKRDPGYYAYIGYIFLEHTHANPVLCVFSNLLMEYRHNCNLGEIKVKSDDLPQLLSLKKLPSTTDWNGSSKEKRCLVARNRWHVAVTLLRNPELAKQRSRIRKTKTVTALLKQLHNPCTSVEV